MRDVPIGGNSRRKFINNVDEHLSSDYGNNNLYDYESLKEKFCPGCRKALTYNAKFNHLVCSSCGYIVDLNEESPSGEENDYGGATTSHSNHRKNDFAEQNNVPAVIPMDQHRNARNRRYTSPEWSKDQDVMRLSDKGYQIKAYSSVVPDTKSKTFNPGLGERDPYFEDRAQEQRRSEGGVLNTKFDVEGQTRKTLKR